MDDFQRKNYEKLLATLDHIELTDKEEKTLQWLAAVETDSIENIISIFNKLSQ